MNIITIPGPTADVLGGNIMTAIATLHDGLVLSDRSSLYYATRAFRGIENRDAAVTVLENALADGKGENVPLQAEHCVHIAAALEAHRSRGETFTAAAEGDGESIETPYEAAAFVRDALVLLDGVQGVEIDAKGNVEVDYYDAHHVLRFNVRIMERGA